MKLVKRYKDFEIEFLIPDDVINYFKNRGVNLEDLFYSEALWFEVILFELIDDDNDGLPDEEIYGKKFQIVFYGIVEKIDKGKELGFELPYNNLENHLIEDNIMMNIDSKFFAKYAVLRKALI